MKRTIQIEWFQIGVVVISVVLIPNFVKQVNSVTSSLSFKTNYKDKLQRYVLELCVLIFIKIYFAIWKSLQGNELKKGPKGVEQRMRV